MQQTQKAESRMAKNRSAMTKLKIWIPAKANSPLGPSWSGRSKFWYERNRSSWEEDEPVSIETSDLHVEDCDVVNCSEDFDRKPTVGGVLKDKGFVEEVSKRYKRIRIKIVSLANHTFNYKSRPASLYSLDLCCHKVGGLILASREAGLAVIKLGAKF